MTARTTLFLTITLLALATARPASAQAEWTVAPYIWYSDISLEQSSGLTGSHLL